MDQEIMEQIFNSYFTTKATDEGTGFSDAITEEKAKAIGNLEYTMKPVVKSDMARAVRRLLDQKNEKWLRHSFLS
jgi:hypothetical protein